MKQSVLKSAREQVEKLSRRKLELDSAIAAKLQDQSTINKAGRAVAKATQEIRNRIVQQVGVCGCVGVCPGTST